MSEAGGIPPLYAMLDSPNASVQACAAGALSALARNNAETQSAVARTGALTPLCNLVKEGLTADVKEKSTAAIWACVEREDYRPRSEATSLESY